MTKDWKTERIENICDFINGGAWSESEYTEKGIPVLKVSNLQLEGIDFSNISYIPKESLSKYSKHQLIKDDLVIATVGSHPSLVNSAAGRATIVPPSVKGYLLNQNAVCLRTKDKEVLNQKFLAYTGKTKLFQHYIQQRGKGAANQMRIAIGAIKDYEIKFPPLETQQKIASILSAYDDLIENNLRRIKLLEEMAAMYFKENFIKIENAKNWKEVKLGTLVGFEIGGGWGEETHSSEFSQGAFVIRGTDINGIPFGKLDEVPFRFHKQSNLASRALKDGDIVFEVSGGSHTEGVGKTLLITKQLVNAFNNQVICASFCKRLSPSKREHSNFIFLLLRYFREIKITEIFEMRSASNIVNYNWSAFLKYQNVRLPDEDSLKLLNDTINPIFENMFNLSTQNRLLKEARDILLPRLMSGEIELT